MRSSFAVALAALLVSPLVALAALKIQPATPGKATPAPPAAPRSRATPAPRATPATPKEAVAIRCANLELKGIEVRPLALDEHLWTDRPVTITKVPEKYQGCRFTQHPAHGLTLKFKVVEDGPVVLGCSSRWGSTAEPDVAKDLTTAKKLIDAGWVRQVRDEVETSSYDMQFLIFTRDCKAGEEFTFRTEKYAPPILIFK
ncbi:MAG TPA: hypothetical protein VGO11_02615 [Chthoniobacteraceae bacterium]|jgi:hypothetical protein|nr:hypothetical protein [Chthoniobacteraceae bacterium]